MDRPFATACFLSFNRPQFLPAAITTAIGYAEHPLEVIVHDDGSSDDELREYLHDAVRKGEISTLIENPPGHNQGQGVALNRMFHMAQGDPILKLDHDLLFHPGWLRRAVEILDCNQEKAEAGEAPPIGVMGLFRYPVEPVKYEDMFIKDWPGREPWEEHEDFVGSGMVIPRDVWDMYGPFEQHSEAFAEDRNFKMKVKAAGAKLALPYKRDLATNQGFGVGPSTVVVDHGKVAEIKKGPVVHG